jgi:hypothetical protein
MPAARYDLVWPICRGGHVMPARELYYCPQCRQLCIDACEGCGTPIRGGQDINGTVYPLPRDAVPAYCTNCGKSFPWTTS